MTAFNIVRFRVKPGHQEQFIAQHRGVKNPGLKGFRGGSLVKTGENTFCFIGEWANFEKIVDARPLMINILDAFREHLEDQGEERGLTDPVSGEVVVKLPATKPAAKKSARQENDQTPKAPLDKCPLYSPVLDFNDVCALTARAFKCAYVVVGLVAWLDTIKPH
jgi:hypothetical protein